MANRYSRYELKPYQSMYVDPGKVQVASILKKRYDDNKLNYDMLNRTVGSMQVLEGDEGLKDAMVNNINGQFSDIAASGAFEIAGNAVSKATTDFMTNEGLIAARQSYANYDLEKKTKAQLRANGAQILFDKEFVRDDDGNLVRDQNGQPILREIASMHRSHYQDPETGEMVTSVYEPKFEQMLGYDEKMADLVANISTSPVFKEMGAVLKTGTYLSNKKVQRVVNGLMGTYLSTDEGIQQMRKLTQLEIDPETGETYTAEKAKEVIQNQMLAIAQKQVGKGSFSYQKNPFWVEQQKPSLVATTSTNVLQNNKLLSPGSVFERNDDGSFKDTQSDSLWDGVLKGAAVGSFIPKIGTIFGGIIGGTIDWFSPDERVFDTSGNYNFSDKDFELAVSRCNGDPKCLEQAGSDMLERYDNLTQEVGGNVQLLSEAQLLAGRDEYVAKLLVENAEMRQSFNSDKEFLEAITREMENTQSQVSKVYTGDMDHIKYMNQNDDIKAMLFSNADVYVRKKDGGFTNNLEEAVERLADIHKVKEKAIYDAIKNGDYSYVGTLAQGHRAGSRLVQLRIGEGEDFKMIQVEVSNSDPVHAAFNTADELYQTVINGYESPDGKPVEYTSEMQNKYGGITKGYIEYKFDYLRDNDGNVIPNSKRGYYPVVTYVFFDKNGQAVSKRVQQEPNKLQELYDNAYQSAAKTQMKMVPTGG